MKIAIHWFRRDLRLADNAALHAAVKNADTVIPLFIWDPSILAAPDFGTPRIFFLLDSLRVLEKKIHAAGGKLVLRHGQVEEQIRTLIRETGATALFFNREYTPYARQRDFAIERAALALGVEVRTCKDDVLQEPGEVLKKDGKPYLVFTPYSRQWRAKTIPSVVPSVRFRRPTSWRDPKSFPLPNLRKLGFSLATESRPAGEDEANAQLQRFISGRMVDYKRLRDFPAQDDTSVLSPHLQAGTISPRTIIAEVRKKAAQDIHVRQNADAFVGELIWRDFYRQILWHFPHVAESCFKPAYNELKWENKEKHFTAWCQGRTGCPIVDAGMRQLNTTGWMHNRMRMITAMYLTKDLLVSWQWGERYFMQKLVDGDLASNNGGWQWSASTGTDAQPYFRIFNPAAQAAKFDPEGLYIHRYIPEIDSRSYLPPIVDHQQQRLKALALFRKS